MARGPAPPPPDPARVRRLANDLIEGGKPHCEHGISWGRPCEACEVLEWQLEQRKATRPGGPYPWPFQRPHWGDYIPWFVAAKDSAVVAPGCICPPTSEQTCQAPLCPRQTPWKR